MNIKTPAEPLQRSCSDGCISKNGQNIPPPRPTINLVATLAGVLCIFGMFLLEHGQRLTSTLSKCGQPGIFVSGLPEEAAAENAIRGLGTNCLPTLLKLLQSHDGELKQFLLRAQQRLPKKMHLLRSDREKQELAIKGFYALGDQAAPLIPALIACLDRPECKVAAFGALRAIGKDSAPHVIPLLKSPDPWQQTTALLILAHFPINNAAQDVLTCANSPDADVRMCAVTAMMFYTNNADLMLSAIMRLLKDPDWNVRSHSAIAAGRDWGAAGLTLRPILENGTNDVNAQVAAYMASALEIINAAARRSNLPKVE